MPQSSRSPLAHRGAYTEELDHCLIIETDSLKPKTLEALREEDFRIVELPFRPTAEQLSRYFYMQLKARSFPVYSVSVYETPNNCATYQERSMV